MSRDRARRRRTRRTRRRAVVDESEDTAYYREPLDDGTALSPLRPPIEEATPPPPFEEPPERPLFATTERRVPAAARAAAAQTAAADRALRGSAGGPPPGGVRRIGRHPGDPTDTGTSGFWPFTDEAEQQNEVHTGKEGRGWLRTAIVVAVLLVLVVAMAIAFNRGRQDGSPVAGVRQATPAPPRRPGQRPVKIAGVSDFDPFADPPEENPDTARNADRRRQRDLLDDQHLPR